VSTYHHHHHHHHHQQNYCLSDILSKCTEKSSRILEERKIILPNFMYSCTWSSSAGTFQFKFLKTVWIVQNHISISASCQNSNSKNNITGWTCSSSGDKKFTHKFGEETLSEVATWNTKSVGERK